MWKTGSEVKNGIFGKTAVSDRNFTILWLYIVVTTRLSFTPA